MLRDELIKNPPWFTEMKEKPCDFNSFLHCENLAALKSLNIFLLPLEGTGSPLLIFCISYN